MKKITDKLIVIAQTVGLTLLLVSSAKAFIPEPNLPEVEVRELTLYDVCVEGTIVPAQLLRAIARAESDEMDWAVGDGGISLGRFQLNEKYHAARARAWGEFNPHDPMQAGRIAARYLEACLLAFPGDEDSGIAAYRQGIYGVKRDGATGWYVKRVRARI